MPSRAPSAGVQDDGIGGPPRHPPSGGVRLDSGRVQAGARPLAGTAHADSCSHATRNGTRSRLRRIAAARGCLYFRAGRGQRGSESAHVPRPVCRPGSSFTSRIRFPAILGWQRRGCRSARTAAFPPQAAWGLGQSCLRPRPRRSGAKPRMVGERIREVEEETAPFMARSGDMSECAHPPASARTVLGAQSGQLKDRNAPAAGPVLMP